MRMLLALLVIACAASDDSTGTVTGTVRLKGEPPKPRKIKVDAASHPGLPAEGLFTEDVVADKEGRLRWALVYVKGDLPEARRKAPEEAAELEVQGFRFTPHVLPMRAGQELKITNRQSHICCAHGLPMVNPEFNASIPAHESYSRRLARAEPPFKVKCDLHPWMNAWIAPFDHPFFAVTDEKGAYVIKGLPPGKHAIEVWHERYKGVVREVEVKGGGETTADFEIVEKKE